MRRYEQWRKSEIRKVRPVKRIIRSLATTVLTLAVLGGLAFGGYKASQAKGADKEQVCAVIVTRWRLNCLLLHTASSFCNFMLWVK